jgi:AmiR/NasT family two-component response regulator
MPKPRPAPPPTSGPDLRPDRVRARSTLLVVDVDPVHRMIVCRAGIQAGFDTVGTTLEEAEILLESRSYDLIALDLSSEPRDAMDIIYHLAAQGSGLPLVVIGADDKTRTEAVSIAGFLGLNVCGSLQTPIDIAGLRRTFDKIERTFSNSPLTDDGCGPKKRILGRC